MRLALLVPALQVDDCKRKLSRLVSIGNVLVCRKTFRNFLPFNSGSDTSANRNMVLVGVSPSSKSPRVPCLLSNVATFCL
jgi:hypothetical protein